MSSPSDLPKRRTLKLAAYSSLVLTAALVGCGKKRDVNQRESHTAMDLVAKIAVLAGRVHPQSSARPASSGFPMVSK